MIMNTERVGTFKGEFNLPENTRLVSWRAEEIYENPLSLSGYPVGNFPSM
jgi:hypothetical protein